MGIENFVKTLYLPEDALTLCEGKLRSQSGLKRSLISDINVLDAAEILIALDDADNICSQSDVVERAMSYGWEPISTSTTDKSHAIKNRHGVRYGWKGAVYKTARFLLKVSSE